MLIDFSISNYKAIKNETAISFVATSLKELPDNIRKLSMKGRKESIKVFTTAGLYGANASGKTTVLDALKCSSQFIRDSTTKYNAGDKLPFTPFLLDAEQAKLPSTFQCTFFIDGILYVYGFSANERTVQDEWLSSWLQGQEKNFFKRKEGIFGAEFKRYEDIRQATRDNALLLSTGATLNEGTCQIISKFFSTIRAIEYNTSDTSIFSDSEISSENISILSSMMQYADTGIQNISLRTAHEIKDDIKEFKTLLLNTDIDEIKNDDKNITSMNDLSSEEEKIFKKVSSKLANSFIDKIIDNYLKTKYIYFKHRQLATSKTGDDAIEFSVNQESDGTLKYLLLLNAALKVFKNGGLLIIDELDAKLHPLLAAGFLKFFQTSGNRSAQLLFSTHATDILDAGVLRRDQIYITEKNDSGATIVNNLAEYKVHKDTVLSKRYLEGRYGGIPYLHEGYFEQADDLVKDSLRPSAPGGDK